MCTHMVGAAHPRWSTNLQKKMTANSLDGVWDPSGGISNMFINLYSMGTNILETIQGRLWSAPNSHSHLTGAPGMPQATCCVTN